MNMFRTFCLIVSLRKSESSDSREFVDLDLGMEAGWEISLGIALKPGAVHSGLDMIMLTDSRKAGLSDSDINWLLFPCSISSRAVHHLFRITVRLSRSSARRDVIEGWRAYLWRKGSRIVRRTFDFCMLGFA